MLNIDSAAVSAETSGTSGRRVVATYDYKDEHGTLLYQVVRYVPKGFVQRRPAGDNWAYKLEGVRRVPYRLPELLGADSKSIIFIVEGEKDVDRLASLDLVATCNVGGAGKWKAEYSEFLRHRSVVIIPDNDDAGEGHAKQVAESLSEHQAAEVRILRLEVPPKGDVSDWLDAGGTKGQLLEQAQNAALLPSPCPNDRLDGSDIALSDIENVAVRRASTQPIVVSDPLQEVLGHLRGVKRIGSGWKAHCPAHPDGHASLSVGAGTDGKVLVRCHAGCTIDSICEAIGLTLSDLFPARAASAPSNSTARSTPPTVSGNKEPLNEKLLKLAAAAELFHDGAGRRFATVRVSNHRETHDLRSGGFRDWLAQECWRAHGKAPSRQVLQDAIDTLAAKAGFGGVQQPVAVRRGEHEGAIYVDLGDPNWRAVKIDGSGWTITDDVPLRFIRQSGVLALPEPQRGGSLTELRPCINATAEDDWILMVAWLLGAYMPRGPYPILSLSGTQGSAKTTTARMLRGLVDPNKSDLRATPKDARDLMIAANNSGVLAFDNLSGLSPWLSDLLCRVATGAGFGTRKNYSDDEEVLFNVSRPILLNGIEEVSCRADLLERSILVDLPAIDSGRRLSEKEVWHRYHEVAPRVLGAVFDAVSTAIRLGPSVKLTDRPRMADFAEWIAAAEPALPWPAGSFLRSYASQLRQGNAMALEGAAVGMAIMRFADDWLGKSGWNGHVAGLLKALEAQVQERDRGVHWPRSPRGLSGQIRRIQPALKESGVVVEFGKHGEHGTPVTVRKMAATASSNSASDSDSETWT